MPDDHTTSDPKSTVTSRRTVLRGVAAAGAIGVATPLIAACGGGGGDTTSPEPAASEPSSDTAPGGSGGTALTPTSAIPEGEGTVFRDQKIVVTQPKPAEFKAFTAICTHMGCTVDNVSNGTINCICHGSMYDISTGAVVHGPATKPLAPIPITVKGDQIDVT